jgi:broad specificity phosphatase PhoE
MSEKLQHLVLVRHGESWGDKRRQAWMDGEDYITDKMPEEEELTPYGEEQCRIAGLWVVKNVIKKYGLPGFDMCLVSSALRSEQSAMAMELDNAVWQEDHCLDERDRGHIRGLRPEQHKRAYPESYKQMKADPLHWAPPGGKAIVPDVVEQARQFLINIEGARSVIAVTHSDWMWGAMVPLEGLDDNELAAVNTDDIHSTQIFNYSSVNPANGEQALDLTWKLSVDPMRPEASAGWQILPRISETIS